MRLKSLQNAQVSNSFYHLAVLRIGFAGPLDAAFVPKAWRRWTYVTRWFVDFNLQAMTWQMGYHVKTAY